ncbi:MAG: ArnT family glycosyltransferase [Anaerolineae bacterium]
MTKQRWWTLLTLTLLIAFALRVGGLTDVPPGLSHDEASNGHDAAAILRGVHRIYFPVGYGHEPLYNYSVALSTLLLGQSIFTLRLTTVVWGMTQTVLVIALARRWWGRTAAVGASAAYSASFWALMMARIGLRAPVLPALLAGCVLAYDHAVTARTIRARWSRYAAAGLLLGASFYTYMASRGMPLIFLTLLLVLLILDRQSLRRLGSGTLAVVLLAVLVGMPLFLYLRANRELEQRIRQLGSALTALRAGEWRPLWRNILASLPMLLWRGDPLWLYNIAGRPALEPLLGALFLVGLGVTAGSIAPAARTRSESTRPEPPRRRGLLVRPLLLLLWSGAGLAPAFLAPVEFNTLHAIGAMPPVMMLVALGFDRTLVALRRIHPSRRRLVRALIPALMAALFIVTGWRSAQAYFLTWGRHRDVRVAYHHHVIALARHLDQASDVSQAVVTSLYPGEYHDPYTVEVALRRTDLDIRWADGRSALFVPTTHARLYVESQTQPPDDLWDLLSPDLVPAATLAFGPDQIPPWIRGYVWDAPASWSRINASRGTQVLVQSGDPPPSVAHETAMLPVAYGEILTFQGYRLLKGRAVPGGIASLLTTWSVNAATDAELVLFSHVLNRDGEAITQRDRLDAPSWQWRPGDRFVQIHRLFLPTDLAPGAYDIAVGWFARGSLSRLNVEPPADIEADAPITRILIPLEVNEP